MPVLLRLDSSADPNGVSRQVAAVFTDEWRAISSRHIVVQRDLAVDQPPYLADAAMHWTDFQRRPDETPPPDALAAQRELVAELMGADVVLIGAPIYNWSVPSSLKAWLEHIHVKGLTATSGDVPPPLVGRPALVVSPRGGATGPGAPGAGLDFGVPMLRAVLGRALGMDVEELIIEQTLADRVDAAKRALREANITRAREQARAAARRLGSCGTASVADLHALVSSTIPPPRSEGS